MIPITPGRGLCPIAHASSATIGQFRSRRWWPSVLAFALLASPLGAHGQTPLRLAEAERLALEYEPGREALLARSTALKERSASEGQLLDPKLRFGLANFPIQSGGFSTEGMTQLQLGIRQEFQRGDSRALRARQLLSLADEVTASAGRRSRDVRSAVRQAWLGAYYWEQAEAIVSESRPFFTNLVAITESLYSVGRRDQQDLLRAELELSRLDDRLLDIQTRLGEARAALSEWIGSAAARPLPGALPFWPDPPQLNLLEQRLAEHPALQAADAQIQAQQDAVELAKAQSKPGWMLDLSYGYREGMLPTGEPRSDFVSLMVTVDLPMFRRNRHDRDVAVALQERRAADESQTQLKRRLLSQLRSEHQRWHALTRRINLHEQLITVQAEDRATASLLAYQSQAGDFGDVMRGSIDQFEARLDLIRLKVERARSFTVLANLGGISP